MINLIHISMLVLGFSAYYFSDVKSASVFYNTLLPVIVLFSFIYGIIVTINMLYKLRQSQNEQTNSNDIVLASLKEHGLLSKEYDVATAILTTGKIHGQSPEPNIIKTTTIVADKLNVEEFIEEDVCSQAEINDKEWRNLNNWSGSSLLSCYFSQADSRLWVPKQIGLLGKTLNLAKPSAIYWHYGLWLVTFVIISVIASTI